MTTPDGVVSLERLKSVLPEEKVTMLSLNDDYKSFETERTVIYQWLAQLSTQCRRLKSEIVELRKIVDPASADVDIHTHSTLPLLPVANSLPADEVAEYIESVETMEEIEKEALVSSLKRNGGSRRKVAEELGIAERTLYRKIKEYGLEDVK